MSRVGMHDDGLEHTIGRRDPRVSGGLESSSNGPASGYDEIRDLAGRIPGAVPRPTDQRAADLLRAAAGPLSAIPWVWTETALIASGTDGRLAMVAYLAALCRAERQRGLAGHWTYDLARHSGLVRLYETELREFAYIVQSEATP